MQVSHAIQTKRATRVFKRRRYIGKRGKGKSKMDAKTNQ